MAIAGMEGLVFLAVIGEVETAIGEYAINIEY